MGRDPPRREGPRGPRLRGGGPEDGGAQRIPRDRPDPPGAPGPRGRGRAVRRAGVQLGRGPDRRGGGRLAPATPPGDRRGGTGPDEGPHRSRHPAGDHPAELRDRAPRPRLRARARPHRAELRAIAERRLLRRAGGARARSPPRHHRRGASPSGSAGCSPQRRADRRATARIGCSSSGTPTAR